MELGNKQANKFPHTLSKVPPGVSHSGLARQCTINTGQPQTNQDQDQEEVTEEPEEKQPPLQELSKTCP